MGFDDYSERTLLCLWLLLATRPSDFPSGALADTARFTNARNSVTE